MTEMTHERRAPADGQQSTTEQAMQKVQETGGEVRQQMGQKAQELRSQAGEGVRRQLDDRSTEAGEQVTTTADVLRRVGNQLRQDGQIGSAQYAERAAQPVERLGRYLTEADADRLLRDAEQFARRRPWVAVMGGATLGFLVARFIKASNTGDGATEQNDRYTQAALSPASGLERGEFDDKSRQ
jgi:ElaB/YqjD/DUF883 family membrane-anchored ribosome-binding protein